MFKRILSLFLAFVLCILFVSTSAMAADLESASQAVSFGQSLVSMTKDTVGLASDAVDFIVSLFNSDYCADSPNHFHDFVLQNTTFGGLTGPLYVCRYCYTLADSVFQTAYLDYISSNSLSSSDSTSTTTTSTAAKGTVLSVGNYNGSNTSSSVDVDLRKESAGEIYYSSLHYAYGANVVIYLNKFSSSSSAICPKVTLMYRSAVTGWQDVELGAWSQYGGNLKYTFPLGNDQIAWRVKVECPAGSYSSVQLTYDETLYTRTSTSSSSVSSVSSSSSASVSRSSTAPGYSSVNKYGSASAISSDVSSVIWEPVTGYYLENRPKKNYTFTYQGFNDSDIDGYKWILFSCSGYSSNISFLVPDSWESSSLPTNSDYFYYRFSSSGTCAQVASDPFSVASSSLYVRVECIASDSGSVYSSLQGYDSETDSWVDLIELSGKTSDYSNYLLDLSSYSYSLYRFTGTVSGPGFKGLKLWVSDNVNFYSGSAFSASDPGADTRPAALTQVQHNYNELDLENKYYIGTVDASNNVTDVYSPVIVDEQTLTFTEPISGKQYLCSDWWYVYWTEDIGSYSLVLADDSFIYKGETITFAVVAYYTSGVTIYYFTSDDYDKLRSASASDYGSGVSAVSACLYDVCTYLEDFAYVISTNTVVECAHEYTSETLVEATCTQEGQVLYTCSLCGKAVTLTVARTDHVWDYETVSEPTCIAVGERKYTCTICGSSYAEDVPATGHSYQYSIYQEPTCDEAGIGLYNCSGCGDEYTEEIPATGHHYALVQYFPSEYDEEGNLVTAAYSLYRCAVCGNEYTETDNGASAENDGLLSWLASLFRSLISALVNGLSSGLEYLVNQVIVTITDLILQVIRWFMGLLDISSISQWFTWFSDDNQYFQNDFGIDSEVDVWAYS